MCNIDINVEEPITAQGALDELNFHQTPRGKSKVVISLCRRHIYQKTDLEDIFSRFDQVRPVVSNTEFLLPKKSLSINNIGEYLKGPPMHFCKEALFVQYDKNKKISLLSDLILIKSLPEGKKVLHSLIAPSIS